MKTVRASLIAVFCSVLLLPCVLSAQTKAFTVGQGNYATIYDLLRDVPGLDVKLGGAGRAASVSIPGTGKFGSGGSAPLIVLNGTIYDGSIANINPHDVAEVTVLKDASSNGAYGARGMNGTIIINTRKGETGGEDKRIPVKVQNGSAYDYFIKNKTMLKVFDWDDKVLFEAVLLKQTDSLLVFLRKKKELMLPKIDVARVEMVPQQ